MFASALALGAVVVNFPLLTRWFPGLGKVVQRFTEGGAPAGPEGDGEVPADSADSGVREAAPGTEPAPWRRPVAVDEEVPDPFVRQRRPDEGAVALPSETAPDPLLDRALPEVTLVLVGDSTRRALVGGKLVAIGDVTEVGRVQAIERDGVTVQVDANRTTKLPLRTSRARGAAADAPVSPSAPASHSIPESGAVPVPNPSGGVK